MVTTISEAARPVTLHEDTLRSLDELVVAAKAGEVTAVCTIAVRPGRACWIIRSRMTSRDRIQLIGQLEYLKWLLVQDEEET